MDIIGTLIKRKYRIDALLDSGGMGHVYRGQLIGAKGFARPVALKMLRQLNASDRRSRDLFTREARACATLQHRNIVSVHDFEVTASGHLMLVMEYVDGVDLDHLARAKPLPVAACLYMAIEVLRALAHAHDRGIVHRDIKPRNILVSRSGEVKLTDFGMAKIADQSSLDLGSGTKKTIKGTIGYLSPEVVRHQPVDGRTDLFTVGVTLYRLLTGHLPFGNTGITSNTTRVLTEQPLDPQRLRPNIPDDLNAIILRLLRENPDDRYACARDVIHALSACTTRAHTIDDMAEDVTEHLDTIAQARIKHAQESDATEPFPFAPSSTGSGHEPRPRGKRRHAPTAALTLALLGGLFFYVHSRAGHPHDAPVEQRARLETADHAEPDPAAHPRTSQAAADHATRAAEISSSATATPAIASAQSADDTVATSAANLPEQTAPSRPSAPRESDSRAIDQLIVLP